MSVGLDPKGMNRVMGGKHYEVNKSTLLADNQYWDGHNYERHGRNEFLYRTQNGNYFTVHMSQWPDELDTIKPLSQAEAIGRWESLPEHYVKYQEAFPGAKVEEA